METPCYKCGEPVEEGTPFCLHCRAPQIRVVIAAPPVPPHSASSLRSDEGATATETNATAGRDVPLRPSESEPVLALPVRWSDAVTPCALASVAALILVLLRLYLGVSLLAAGFLAVVFYRQRRPGAVLKAASGARLGALSGLFSFTILAVLTALMASSQDLRGKMREQFLGIIQQVAASHQGDQGFQSLLEMTKTPEGVTTLLILVSIFSLILAVALGSLGGAIGGAILGRRNRD